MSHTSFTHCPKCSAELPVHEGFLTWCDQCEWNLTGAKEKEEFSFREKFYASMGRKHSQLLFDSIVRAQSLRPALSLSAVIAYGFAICIHFATILLLGAGLAGVLFSWPNIVLVLLGFVCLGVVWLARPQFEKIPHNILPRNQFPALHQLVDAVSDQLGALPVDGIVIKGYLNAAFGRAGWKQKRILYLGLPLWAILSNEEKIDLLGHEIAHDVNRDNRRGMIIGMAINTLYHLYVVLYPPRLWPTETGIYGLGAVPFTLLSLGLSYIVRFCALGLEHLLWSNSQRAEYYADILGASVAGKQASLSGMEKILYGDLYQYEVRKIALQHKTQENLFDNWKQSIKAIPERETERLKRVEHSLVNHMNIFHPPGFLRIRMIEALAPEKPSLTLPDSLFDEIRQEMKTLEARVQHDIIDNYRARIHW